MPLPRSTAKRRQGRHGQTMTTGSPLAQELRDERFGMRRFRVANPNGLLMNISSFP